MRVRILLGALVLVAGCASSGPPADQGTTEESFWVPEQFSQHLTFLNAPQTEGRGPTTRGANRAAEYVANRLFEGGLQPVRSDSYRTIQPVELWTLDAAGGMIVDGDTTILTLGRDFLVDAQSGSGSAVADLSAGRGLRIRSASSAVTNADSGGLVLLRDSVSLGVAAPVLDGTPVIFPLKPLRDRLGWTGTHMPTGRLHVEVKKNRHVAASTVHVGGFIPGRSVRSRDSLLVIVAPLDGQGQQGGVAYTDGSRPGIAATALVELAHRASAVQQQWKLFDYTILVTFVSGLHPNCPVSERWLRTLPWDRTAVRAILVMQDRRTSCTTPDPGLDIRYVGLSSPGLSVNGQGAVTGGIVRQSEMIRGSSLDELIERSRTLARTSYRIMLDLAANDRIEP